MIVPYITWPAHRALPTKPCWLIFYIYPSPGEYLGTLGFEPLTRLCGEVILEILIFWFGGTCMALKAGFPLELARREIKAKPRFVHVL